MSAPNPKRDVIVALLERFPTAATKTLARMAYAENLGLWADLETCRSNIRYYRGASGSSDRRKAKNSGSNAHFRKPQKSGDPFSRVPDARKSGAQWAPVEIDGPLNVLVLADIHIPYHDPSALKAAMAVGKHRAADFIFLNGDAIDCHAVSHWENNPKERDFPGELQATREFLSALRDLFPKARIVMKEGNHENRHTRYMLVKAPEYLGVEEFELPRLLRLDDYGVEWVADCRPVRLGKLNVIHGHEYRFSISNPVNPARGFFLRAGANVMGSHLHQTSQHSARRIDQHVVSAWSTGCLCDLHPDYSRLNNWNHGAAFVEIDKDGAFQVDNFRIFDGRVYR